MKRAYHYFVTVLLAFVHPTNKLPAFKYFCKHIEGEPDEWIKEAEFELKKFPQYFR